MPRRRLFQRQPRLLRRDSAASRRLRRLREAFKEFSRRRIDDYVIFI